MSIKISVYFFTNNGEILADKICDIKDQYFRSEKLLFCKKNMDECNFIDEESFGKNNAHVFVGAVGIAVRKIAPFIKSKVSDPAVIVVDEKGENVIPILSGHIGGANIIANIIADFINGRAVITTATDVNGIEAIDVIAANSLLQIKDKESIKRCNSKLLKGEKVKLFIDENIEVIPNNKRYELCDQNEADMVLSGGRCYVVGVGCKKNIDEILFRNTIEHTLEENNISFCDIDRIVSIDIKGEEKAIVSFANEHKLKFETYSADELNSTEGDFDESEFVKEVTGTSNVSERACIYAANLMRGVKDEMSNAGEFVLKRKAENGVTISIFKVRKRIDLNGKA